VCMPQSVFILYLWLLQPVCNIWCWDQSCRLFSWICITVTAFNIIVCGNCDPNCHITGEEHVHCAGTCLYLREVDQRLGAACNKIPVITLDKLANSSQSSKNKPYI
jgi:hypothetical protein